MSEKTESHLHKESSNEKRTHQETLTSEDTLEQVEKRRTSIHSEMTPNIARMTRLFKCHYCNYSCNEKGLIQHIRMHGQSSGTAGKCEIPQVPPSARYCANCDIQFRGYETYLVHKELYCSTTQDPESMTSSSPPNSRNLNQAQHQNQTPQPLSPENLSTQQSTSKPESTSKNNMAVNQSLYAAISTSPLILVPCSYVIEGLSSVAGLIPTGNIIIPNQLVSPDGGVESRGTNVIPTYTVVPGVSTAVPAVSSPARVTEDIVKQHSKSTNVKEIAPKRAHCKSPRQAHKYEAEYPSHLSVKRNEIDAFKSNSSKSSDSGHRIPIFTSSSSCLSREGNAQRSSIAQPLPMMPIDNPVVELNLMNRNVISGIESTLPVLGPSQVLVKQGTNKCKECNIVFYKHETYLVHKNAYCPARVVQQNPEVTSPEKVKADDIDSSDKELVSNDTRKSPLLSSRVNNARIPPVSDVRDSREASPNQKHPDTMLQYYCMPCGIKYSSIDNLRDHQLYYCPKRDATAPQPVALVPSFPRNSQDFKCTKCLNAYPTEELLKQHPCVVQRKCPYCDVYCPTLSGAQRHLFTHMGIKSFRCSLCGYKGHTVRSMRTHIKIHLDENSSTPEEAYILCMDEGGTEIGCASRKPSGSRLNSDRIKSVIGTEPPHGETALAVSPVSGASTSILRTDVADIKAIQDDSVATGDTIH